MCLCIVFVCILLLLVCFVCFVVICFDYYFICYVLSCWFYGICICKIKLLNFVFGAYFATCGCLCVWAQKKSGVSPTLSLYGAEKFTILLFRR